MLEGCTRQKRNSGGLTHCAVVLTGNEGGPEEFLRTLVVRVASEMGMMTQADGEINKEGFLVKQWMCDVSRFKDPGCWIFWFLYGVVDF